MTSKFFRALLFIALAATAACTAKPVKSGTERKLASEQAKLSAFEDHRGKLDTACSFGEYASLIVQYVPDLKETALFNLSVYKNRNDAALATLSNRRASKRAKHEALNVLIQQTEASLALQAPYLDFACGSLVSGLTTSLSLLKTYASSGKFDYATIRLKEVNKELDQVAQDIKEI
ncbi:MAG: hypothetical protein HYW49_08215 [Deltaproteobacteria bacterium]|nr:hypothetical protein [Deltaproteobacteria bacterium]